jgi:hypothetical protein
MTNTALSQIRFDVKLLPFLGWKFFEHRVNEQPNVTYNCACPFLNGNGQPTESFTIQEVTWLIKNTNLYGS